MGYLIKRKLDRRDFWVSQVLFPSVHMFLHLLYLFYYCFNFRFVIIATEAMDTLLVTCHAQSLNLFVESFLKMVQKSLEQNNPDLQIMATASVCMAMPF